MESLEKLERLPVAESLENIASTIETGNMESNVKALESDEYISDTKESIPDAKELNEWYNPYLETTEIVTDLEMTEGIANYLETVREFRYENWAELTLEEKTEVLNRVEQKIAEMEHRPALEVMIEDMKPNSLGYHSNTEHQIVLNSKHVGANDPKFHKAVFDTLIHEGRHAYQHYNVDVKCVHESVSEVEQWKKNFYDPEWGYYTYRGQKVYTTFNDGQKHDVGFRLYANQPVEIDARNFASDVMLRLEKKGLVSSDSIV